MKGGIVPGGKVAVDEQRAALTELLLRERKTCQGRCGNHTGERRKTVDDDEVGDGDHRRMAESASHILDRDPRGTMRWTTPEIDQHQIDVGPEDWNATFVRMCPSPLDHLHKRSQMFRQTGRSTMVAEASASASPIPLRESPSLTSRGAGPRGTSDRFPDRLRQSLSPRRDTFPRAAGRW